MKAHSAGELRFSATLLGPDASTVRVTGLRVGLTDLTGRRLEQAQLIAAETSHVMVARYGDVVSQLDTSCYMVVDGITYIVDYMTDPRTPRPYMWVEIFCHAEGFIAAPQTPELNYIVLENSAIFVLDDGITRLITG